MSEIILEAIASPTIYRWPGATAKLRIFANAAFITSDGSFIGQGNSANVNSFYLETTCTISGNTLYIPSIQIDSTTDSPTNPAATYTAILYTNTGARVGVFLANFPISDQLPNLTWGEVILYKNQAPSRPLLQGVWDTGQVQTMINTALAQLRYTSSTQIGMTAGTVDPEDPAFPIAVMANDPNYLSLLALLSGGGFYFLSNYASLIAAVAAIGNDLATLLIATVADVPDDLTMPDNITVFRTNAGGIRPATGKTVTIQGPIVATPEPLFYNALAGEGTVTVAQGVLQAAWWDGGDMGDKLIAAYAALPTTGGVVDAISLTGAQTISADVTLAKRATTILLGISTITMGTNRFIVSQGTTGVSIIGSTPWGHGDNASNTNAGTELVYTGTSAPIVAGSAAGQTYNTTVRNITFDCRGSASAGAIIFTNTLFGTINQVLGRGWQSTGGSGVGISLIGSNSIAPFSGLNTVSQFRMLNFNGGVRLFGPDSSVNANRIYDGNIAAVSFLVAGARALDLDGGESNYVWGVDLEGYSEGIRLTHDLNYIQCRMENIGSAADSPAGYSIKFEAGAGQNQVYVQPALNAMETVIDNNDPSDNFWDAGITRGGALIVNAVEGGRYFSPTDLFTGFSAFGNQIIEIGNATAYSTNTPFSSFTMAANKTLADRVIAQIAFANRAIADGSDKRIAHITSMTGTTTNSGILQFATMQGGVGAERARINEAGLWNSYRGANVASAASIVPTGNTFVVTGTVNITSIDTTGIQDGTDIMLIFQDVLTVVDGSNLIMAGNFVTSANDTISFKFVAGNWFEQCRSVN